MNRKSSGALTEPPSALTETGAQVTIPVKRCCGVLAQDECDCAQFAAEARGVFARPIMCRPASEWNN